VVFFHWRSRAERCDVFSGICLFMSLFANMITSEQLNIGWWNLGRCIVQILVEFTFQSHNPFWSPPLKMWHFDHYAKCKQSNGSAWHRLSVSIILCLRQWKSQHMLSSLKRNVQIRMFKYTCSSILFILLFNFLLEHKTDVWNSQSLVKNFRHAIYIITMWQQSYWKEVILSYGLLTSLFS